VGVIIYSDPFDDGWRRGDKYPDGPWRPDTGVQRGSVGYMFEFLAIPRRRICFSTFIAGKQAHFSAAVCADAEGSGDAAVLSRRMADPSASGRARFAAGVAGRIALHVSRWTGPVRVKMHLKQDYQFRTLWDVIGRIRGSESPDEWVVAGNHRDAWVYGAVDPSSGTAAMLEAVHGVGDLLKSGWKPKRTMIFASWDGKKKG